ncbi:glycine dehydrogenase [Synergistales bacterium]|nr:glycine dehydrogenase [Synergistales bacterium]
MGTINTERKFQEARWDEPIILEMGNSGERGVLMPSAEEKVQKAVGPADALLPEGLRRKNAPALPELSQMQVLRHYLRLSQETIGTDINIDIGLGTCTMKYSPKIHENFVRSPKVRDLHPYQDESTVQGMLEIIYKTQEYLKSISGMDAISLQPSGGSQAIYGNVAAMRRYHEEHGNGHKDEIITTILSHPANPGAASTLGYKVITLYPGPDGCPDIEALKAAISDKTAGLMITNPEDTGIYNERIREFVDLVHSVGGLCCYDQANLNGVFGLTRAKDAGFDMCHYNLHKSFSSPHGCQGPGAGAQCVTSALAKYLATPTVEFDGNKYFLDGDHADSIGKLRKFYGVPAVMVRTYAYIRTLGADGMKQIAELSILNNNYLLLELLKIKGLNMPLAEGKRRLEQARLSWEELTGETGVTTDDICRRIVDYGFQDYFASHHPRVIPEPFTPEPVETYSKDDIDEFVAAFKSIAKEAYETPEVVKSAPHKAALYTQIDDSGLSDIDKFAVTWRAYKKYVAKK